MPTKGVYLSDELYVQLVYLSMDTNLPLTDLIRMAIEKGLAVLKEEKEKVKK